MSTTRTPLMAGNWKSNLNHQEAVVLVQKIAFTLKEPELEAAEVVVVPPFTAIRSVQTLVQGDKIEIGFGAQDVSAQDSGAYTGEVSGSQLAALGCTYVVVGHSERRAMHAETDEVVASKVQAALRHGLVPILCAGEGLDVRKAGEHVPYTTAQVDAALEGLDAATVAGIVIAYEPVWAIGERGREARPEEVAPVVAALAELTGGSAAGRPVLYGGSVTVQGAPGVLEVPGVDGLFVGRTAWRAEGFVALLDLVSG